LLWVSNCVRGRGFEDHIIVQDALHELALMGYTSGDSLAAARKSEKFDFTSGTGTGRRNNKRRGDKSARAQARRSM